MEAVNIFVDMLKFAIPFIVGWNVWIHKLLIANQTEIAVNSARDTEVWKSIAKMDLKLDNLQDSVNKMIQDIAFEKGKNSV